MTVTHQLLTELVNAYENSLKFSALKSELISCTLKLGKGPKSYRCGEYNIQIDPHPFRGSHVTVMRAQDLTPEPKSDAACEIMGQSNSAYERKPETREAEAVAKALDALEGGFSWNRSKQGRQYWVDISNRLRAALGIPSLLR